MTTRDWRALWIALASLLVTAAFVLWCAYSDGALELGNFLFR